jgi:hypothetical protein
MADPAVDEPLDDVGWRAHLFRSRSEEQIGQWARALRYFRFCRGQASPFFTGPDRLVVALGWTDDRDRRAVLDGLGLTDDAGDADEWHELAGTRVRVERRPDRVLLSVSGAEARRPEIVDRDVDAAARVEALVDPIADHVVDPPIDDRSCISPARYPRLFAEPG